ncbi:relaxin-3 receptor 1-like [Heterodontus francisci]|uniref:relaxin-3 receptor 1-like n=1 Tax=Heterodontus francisci TaxID=7792 RepID=UPI00355AE8D1
MDKSLSERQNYNLYDIDVPGDGSPALRIIISITYSIVCAIGLVGNLLVFFLMKVKQERKKSIINFFILNLAVTDFQFVLTLPFWAVDTALDFSWPFGDAMCKIILSVTVMNMYASVFFLTAMAMARYWSVASALKTRRNRVCCSVKWVSFLLWVAASLATLPTAIFSSASTFAGEKLCLLNFPDDGQYWLALYHIQKITLAFILPMIILSICYLLLVRFLGQHHISTNNPRRKSRVTRSITIVMLSFFLCWLPNHIITFWGVLVKFNAVPWDKTYYTLHAYVFPVTVCLAHTNSCLNPVLYCLMRRDFRKSMKEVFWKISSPAMTHACAIRPFTDTFKQELGDIQVGIPLNVIESEHYNPASVYNSQCENKPYTTQENPS